MLNYKNPILKGFNPDPSICRVDKDFYMVTSSFQFFPGVPIYHSTNLVEWELINYCLNDKIQLDLEGVECSRGIYAPTIRYHNGRFYMITTNVAKGGNYIVYTDDIYGKWSEPVWVDQGGIDPSLFFEEDGRCYFCNTLVYQGKPSIFAFEINPITGEIIGEKHIISHGTGGKFPEAPHIYKINGYYYLMLAEGGTEYGHMETILRSKSIFGPYVSCPRNPILTHRDYMGAKIQATGHGDLIEDRNGNWWMVCLGVRKLACACLHNLGRESFLCPVTWDNDGWPIVGNDGKIELEMDGPLPGEYKNKDEKECVMDYLTDGYRIHWNFVRNPDEKNYRFVDGQLYLSGNENGLSSYTPTFSGIRQTDFYMSYTTETELADNCQKGEAGITAYYSKDYFYSMSISKNDDGYEILLKVRLHGYESIANYVYIDTNNVKFRLRTDMNVYEFLYETEGKWNTLGKLSVAGLCSEGTMTSTFTGTYIGLYATDTDAKFSHFIVKNEG